MKTVVLISANSEWRALRNLLPDRIPQPTQLGESFLTDLGAGRICFFHGGWGKISAAATAQYVLDHFTPDLLVNLGTCGGLAGRIAPGTVILVEKTIVYDIVEQMSDPQEAIAHYSTHLDLSWLDESRLPPPTPGQPPRLRGLLVSADRDILAGDVPMLIEKYGAVAADWESGAIAWVAQRNGVRCLILRGVTDLVGAGGGEAYGDIELFQVRTQEVMKTLLAQLPAWLAAVG